MRKIACLLLLIILSVQLSAQDLVIKPGKGTLVKLLDSTRRIKADSLRLQLNQEFTDSLYNYISTNIRQGVNLDSVNISNIVSDDGNIRILTWNIQQNNGENLYTGFIIHKALNRIIPLKFKGSDEVVPEDKVFRDGEWPAGIFYRIIQRPLNSGINYTLLSWDGFNKRTSRKSIDALGFDDKGNAVFGGKIFKTKEGFKNRIVVEYSASASFTMQYTRQKATLTGVRKSQRNINDEMIVFDRLVPMHEELKGQRWAYVPAGNIYDAFTCFEGYWTLTEDIVAKNEAAPKSSGKKEKKPALDLLPKE